jgi:hypothetical protein
LTEEISTEEVSAPAPVPVRRSRVRRTGCIIALILWFVILLSPCFLIVLAVQQEISISTGSAPGQQIRLWLVSEADQRGLGLSTGSVRQTGENAICMQTDVRFFLWSGSADPVNYCECYEHASSADSWSATTTTTGVCSE